MSHRRIISSRFTLALSLCMTCLLGMSVAFAQDKADRKEMKFAQNAAMAGMAEVKLGQLALEKSNNDDIKKFAQMMVDDHTKANDELKSMAQSKSIELPTDIGKHQKDYDKLSKLSGTEFDKEYADGMVKDHKEVVSMFEKEANKGDDPDTKAWAAKTLPTLQMHLQHAQDLQKMMKGK